MAPIARLIYTVPVSSDGSASLYVAKGSEGSFGTLKLDLASS